MKALKVALLLVVLLGLGIIAGCQNEAAMMSTRITSSDRVVWEQGQTGFPHPKIAYTTAR